MTDLTSPPAIVVEARDPVGWAQEINDLQTQSVEATLVMCVRMAKRVGALVQGEKAAFYEALFCSEDSAQRYARVGRHPFLANTAHGRYLPGSWRTLAELARIDDVAMARYVDDGRIHPTMTRDAAETLVKGYFIEIREYLLALDKAAAADEKPVKQVDAWHRFAETLDDFTILDPIEPAADPGIRALQIETIEDTGRLVDEYHARIQTQVTDALTILKGDTK